MPFECTRQLTRIVNMNVRTEKHGDDHVVAVDLSVRVMLSNDTLVLFSPTLKSSLYMKDESPQMELDSDPHHLTVLKNPKMGAIKWDEAHEHARAVVHFGASGIDDIVFGDAKVNKFVIQAKEGGSYELGYRIQSHPTEEEIARLTTVLDGEVEVTVDADGGEEEVEYDSPDTGAGANEIAEEFAAQKDPAKRRGRKQMALVE